jgi:hypothetical protein
VVSLGHEHREFSQQPGGGGCTLKFVPVPAARRELLSGKHVRWGIGLASTAVAAVCLYVASEVRDDSFWSSILVNVGTAFLLAIPAILVERLFDRRISEAQDSIDTIDDRLHEVSATVGNVSSQLDELQQGVVTAVERDRKDEFDAAIGPAKAARSRASFASVHKALVHARDTHATTASVFVPLTEKGLTLRFEPRSSGTESSVLVTVVPDNRKAPNVEQRWKENESVEDLFRRLDEQLRDRYGRRAAPQLATALSTVFTTLARTLELAQERRLDLPGPDDRKPPVIELATDHWLVSKAGLEKVGDPSRSFDVMDVIRYGGSEREAPVSDDPHGDELPYALAVAYRRIVTEHGGSRI